MILVLYVDDLFLTGSSRLIKDYKENLATEFDMKDLGLMHYFLGLEVWQQKGEIFLGQGRYTTKILKRFQMEDCRPMMTPMITIWKKIDTSKDDEADPTLYRIFDVSGKHKAKHMLCCKYPQSVHCRT